MLWWIVAALVVVPLLMLGAVVVSLRDQVVELHRVRALAQERAQRAADRLATRAAGLRPRAVQLHGQTLAAQARAASLTGRGTGKLSP